jgi:recombination protein RecA
LQETAPPARPVTEDRDSSRFEALSGVLHQIERSYGKGSIQKLGHTSSVNVETFPSGSITFDAAMGGGYPRGRVIEIYGPESSGKTTLALHAVAEIQKLKGICPNILLMFLYLFRSKKIVMLFLLRDVCMCLGTAAFIDAEHALDPVYATKLGVNVDELFLCQVKFFFKLVFSYQMQSHNNFVAHDLYIAQLNDFLG